MEDGAPGGFQSSYPMPNLTEGILDSTYLRPPPWPHPMTDTTTSSNPRDWPSTKESSPASFGGDDFSDSKRLTESPLSDSELYAPSLSHSASTNSSVRTPNILYQILCPSSLILIICREPIPKQGQPLGTTQDYLLLTHTLPIVELVPIRKISRNHTFPTHRKASHVR
jgi:hypothetical protein